MTLDQLRKWDIYLHKRDLENKEPFSWFDIITDKYGHKAGLEKILNRKMSTEEFQKIAT